MITFKILLCQETTDITYVSGCVSTQEINTKFYASENYILTEIQGVKDQYINYIFLNSFIPLEDNIITLISSRGRW